MRYVVIPLLAAAVLIAAVAALLAVAGVTLEQTRDIVVIAYGVLGALFFLVAIAVAIAILAIVRAGAAAGREAFEESVRPALDDARASVRSVRGSVEFVADHAVSPVIRAAAAARGMRRGAAAAAVRAVRRGR